MTYKPEEIGPNEIQHGDVLHLPDIEGGFVYVVEVLPGSAGAQYLKVRPVGGHQGEELPVAIPWFNTVNRLGNVLR